MTLHRIALLVAVTGALALTSCDQNRITRANYEKIHEGMTLREVELLLGPSDETRTAAIPVVGGETTVSTFRTSKSRIVITFKNDIVKKKEAQFED